jgi:hypothetical protein
MINIPLPFFVMWLIMLAGVATHMLFKIKKITDITPPNVPWKQVKEKFIRKEWPSYCISFIFTCIIAYSFVFMKQFENPNNEEISRWAKWLPLSVLALYFIGVLNQWLFYWILGRIQSKGKIDYEILNEPPTPKAPNENTPTKD